MQSEPLNNTKILVESCGKTFEIHVSRWSAVFRARSRWWRSSWRKGKSSSITSESPWAQDAWSKRMRLFDSTYNRTQAIQTTVTNSPRNRHSSIKISVCVRAIEGRCQVQLRQYQTTAVTTRIICLDPRSLHCRRHWDSSLKLCRLWLL